VTGAAPQEGAAAPAEFMGLLLARRGNGLLARHWVVGSGPSEALVGITIRRVSDTGKDSREQQRT